MSRIIVKNLPKNIKEDRVRSLFGEIGPLTDCSLKYTKEGSFRRFAFIGYTSDEVAQKAVTHFDQSFIDTSRLHVEVARELGDGDKPRAPQTTVIEDRLQVADHRGRAVGVHEDAIHVVRTR